MSIIEQFSQVRVLCLGDVMLDRFITGAARRISPESPVPVLSVSSSATIAGGSAHLLGGAGEAAGVRDGKKGLQEVDVEVGDHGGTHH